MQKYRILRDFFVLFASKSEFLEITKIFRIFQKFNFFSTFCSTITFESMKRVQIVSLPYLQLPRNGKTPNLASPDLLR